MQFLENKYAKLALLTLGIAALIYIVIWLLFMVLGVKGLPVVLQLFVSVGGAGLLVYKFLAGRVF